MSEEFLTASEREWLRTYLAREYAGVWDRRRVESFIAAYAGADVAEAEVAELAAAGVRGRILDIGSGLGSFVIAARHRGYTAFGVDIAEADVRFATRRAERRAVDQKGWYAVASGERLPFADATFSAVTMWNLLEHVADPEPLLIESARVLTPGGIVLILCPNYFSLRNEAHYDVPWPPLLPKAVGKRYLSALGRDPWFLLDRVHYRTNWGVLRAIRRVGLRPVDPRAAKLDRPILIRRRPMRALARAMSIPVLREAARAALTLLFVNPVRPSVWVWAVKRSSLGDRGYEHVVGG